MTVNKDLRKTDVGVVASPCQRNLVQVLKENFDELPTDAVEYYTSICPFVNQIECNR